jgi:hypothetical protein
MLCATSVLLFLGHCFPVASIVRDGSVPQGTCTTAQGASYPLAGENGHIFVRTVG